MKILALEFSSNLRSVVVYDADIDQPLATISEEFGRRTAMTLIDEAIRGAGLKAESIQLVAVGLGPGSNAGVRSAIAIAQGWQLARGTMTVGMSSTECLASAETLARMAASRPAVSASNLEPIYAREVAFVKAPPPRSY